MKHWYRVFMCILKEAWRMSISEASDNYRALCGLGLDIFIGLVMLALLVPAIVWVVLRQVWRIVQAPVTVLRDRRKALEHYGYSASPAPAKKDTDVWE